MTAHLPRLRTLAIPALFAATTLMVFAGVAHAETIDPMGVGDLLPSPDSKIPKGQGTLYEEYSNPALWLLDADYGMSDVFEPPVHLIASILAGLVALLGTAVVVIVQWVFGVTSLPPLQDALAKLIEGSAKGLTTTLLPTALCIGGFVAFAKHREGGGSGGLSQVAWVMLSGVVCVSLLNSPQMWVDGVDSGRQIGSSIALNATSSSIGTGNQEFPFKLGHEPTFTGNGRDDMIRKSSDAVWRTYVAAPWCIAEFGSFEACEKYGKTVLDKGNPGDDSDRKKWMQDNLNSEKIGKDSEQWWEGHQPVQRVVVELLALVVLLVFALLVLTLAFASLASLLGALMLLVTGPVFACLWVIPGRTRQWGVRWFDQLVGFTLQAFVVTTVLGSVLVIQVGITKMFGVYGWGPSAGLSIAAAIVAMKFRKVIESIIGVSGTSSPLGAVAGLLATRAAGRLLKSGGTRPQPPTRPTPKPSPGGGGGGGGGGGQGELPPGGPSGDHEVTISRVPYPRPSPRPIPAPRRAPAELPASADPATPTATTPKVVTGTVMPPKPPKAPAGDRNRPEEPKVLTGTVIHPRPPTADTRRPETPQPAGTALPPRSASPDTPQPGQQPAFRQAAAPGRPGPRAIEAATARTPSTPARPALLAHRPRATQPPPPGRRPDTRRPNR
ncbi:type IV secretion system protein [Streptomyces sp. NPDC001272]